MFKFCIPLLLVCSHLSAQTFWETRTIEGDLNDQGELFGSSIALDQGLLAVGAYKSNALGFRSGLVYLYSFPQGIEAGRLEPFEVDDGDEFGKAIAMNQQIIAVGAPEFDHEKFLQTTGAIFLFDRASHAEIRRLDPFDENYPSIPSNIEFGQALAISDELVAVGAPGYGVDYGAVYVFDLSDGELLHILHPETTQRERFGSSLNIEGDVLVVGAPYTSTSTDGSGYVYLFQLSTGLQTHRFNAEDSENGSSFGLHLDIHDGILAVGAPNFGTAGVGAAYLFDLATQVELFNIGSDTAEQGEDFGAGIEITEDYIFIGAPSSGLSGAAYMYDRTGNKLGTIRGSVVSGFARFGSRIIFADGMLAVSAFFDDLLAFDTGRVYLYETLCPADLNRDGSVNFFDVTVFIAAIADQDSIGDFNDDGMSNFFDIAPFINAYQVGCY